MADQLSVATKFTIPEQPSLNLSGCFASASRHKCFKVDAPVENATADLAGQWTLSDPLPFRERFGLNPDEGGGILAGSPPVRRESDWRIQNHWKFPLMPYATLSI
jgi:hypothetical protein